MARLKAIGKEIKLKEFRGRSCTICNNRVTVDSYNGRTQGKFGSARGKILKCECCNVLYYYDWDYKKEKYIIDYIIFDGTGDTVTAFIDYSGVLKKVYKCENHGEDQSLNIFIRLDNSNGCYREHIYFAKTFGMPKKKLFKMIIDKAETYAVFA